MDAKSEMELPEAEIRGHYPQALSLVTGFDHAPRLGKPAPAAPLAERSPGIPSASRFRSTTPGLAARSTARPSGVRLIERIEAVGGDDLPSPAAATTARDLRRAVAIALAVADEVAARSGAAELKRANLEGRLPPERRSEFSELLAVKSLAALSVLANATAFLLAEHAGPETVEGITADEILTDNPLTALQGALWELDQNLTRASDDKTLIATTIAFAEALSTAVAARAETAPRMGAFTGASWRVAADDFPIAGFTPATKTRGKPLSMAFKKPEEVIGNAIAKHQAMRLARMLVAYDFDRRMNPFVELGGFVFTFLGDGKPGTGKTTLIQMMAGMLNDYCTIGGYPFRYANLSVDNIDSYQGKSGQNARAFINSIIDPAVIGFGTIDDIDQIAGKRGDRQSSSGQQEITAVLMEAFAGASTVVRGNCTFGMFSNYAEAIDDALVEAQLADPEQVFAALQTVAARHQSALDRMRNARQMLFRSNFGVCRFVTEGGGATSLPETITAVHELYTQAPDPETQIPVLDRYLVQEAPLGPVAEAPPEELRVAVIRPVPIPAAPQ